MREFRVAAVSETTGDRGGSGSQCWGCAQEAGADADEQRVLGFLGVMGATSTAGGMHLLSSEIKCGITKHHGANKTHREARSHFVTVEGV